MSLKNLALALLLGLGSLGAAQADELVLNPDHPDRYVVVKGDTLWDISAKFLRDPWRWPEIWHNNPDIENPHLIYPGDVIVLTWRDGKPVLSIERGRATVKLSPQLRRTRIDTAIPPVPAAAIGQFIAQPRVFTEEELEGLGYIVATEEERLVVGNGSKIYVRNLPSGEGSGFSIYHVGDPYYHPETEELLGYEAKYVGDAELVREGDPSTLVITHAQRETLLGDKVMAAEGSVVQENLVPHAPDVQIEGQIISIFEGVSRGGLYHSVVLDVGRVDGLEPGHVLAVDQKGVTVRDYLAKRRADRWVTTPPERAALVMVYQVFENVSYALVMNAQRDVRVEDIVTNP